MRVLRSSRTAAVWAVAAVAALTVPANAITSTTGWQNFPLTAQTSVFVAEFDAVPSAAGIDGVVWLSTAAVSGYGGGAAMVRFNEQGSIDARNGIAYEADAAIAYAAGRTYHFRLTIDPTTHTYSVYVTPAGASEQTLATSYAFRTEQAAASSLANWGLIAEIGSLAVSNFTISGLVTVDAGANQTITLPAYAVVRGTVKVMGSSTLPAGTSLAWSKASGPGTVTFSSPSTLNTAAYFSTAGSYQLQLAASYVGKWFTDVTTVQVNAAPMSNGMTSTAIWQNTAFTAQGGSFTAGFDVIPNALGIDGITALSTSAIASYSTAAAIVRFNTGGTIDVRNGGTYAAVTSIAYTAGKSYHFRLVVNVPYHTYSVYVTPAGGTEQTLATNYGFRTEQASATSLANWGLVAETGSHTVSNFQLTAAPSVAEAGPAVTINAGAATVLNGSCSGGTAPYTYTWSPGTGPEQHHDCQSDGGPERDDHVHPDGQGCGWQDRHRHGRRDGDHGHRRAVGGRGWPCGDHQRGCRDYAERFMQRWHGSLHLHLEPRNGPERHHDRPSDGGPERDDHVHPDGQGCGWQDRHRHGRRDGDHGHLGPDVLRQSDRQRRQPGDRGISVEDSGEGRCVGHARFDGDRQGGHVQ